jgi:hypothetical protein
MKDVSDRIEQAPACDVIRLDEGERGAAGEVWLVLCSCGELCEPTRITPETAHRALRVFADQITESRS